MCQTVFDKCSSGGAEAEKSREIQRNELILEGNWFFPSESPVQVFLKGMKTFPVASRADCSSFFSRWRGERHAFEFSFLFLDLCQPWFGSALDQRRCTYDDTDVL